MSERLRNKTALVTGSTSNIGQAIAEAFAAEGAHVVVSGRNERRGASLMALTCGDDVSAPRRALRRPGSRARSRAVSLGSRGGTEWADLPSYVAVSPPPHP